MFSCENFYEQISQARIFYKEIQSDYLYYMFIDLKELKHVFIRYMIMRIRKFKNLLSVSDFKFLNCVKISSIRIS